MQYFISYTLYWTENGLSASADEKSSIVLNDLEMFAKYLNHRTTFNC